MERVTSTRPWLSMHRRWGSPSSLSIQGPNERATHNAHATTEQQLARIAEISSDTPTIITLDHLVISPDLHLPLHQWLRTRLVSADAAPDLDIDPQPLAVGQLGHAMRRRVPVSFPTEGPIGRRHVARGGSRCRGKVLGRRLHALYKGAPGLIARQIDALHDSGWPIREGHRLRPGARLPVFARMTSVGGKHKRADPRTVRDGTDGSPTADTPGSAQATRNRNHTARCAADPLRRWIDSNCCAETAC